MHNLALALYKKGYHITGSDDEIFEPSKSRLQKAGLLPPAWGWFPEKITPELVGGGLLIALGVLIGLGLPGYLKQHKKQSHLP